MFRTIIEIKIALMSFPTVNQCNTAMSRANYVPVIFIDHVWKSSESCFVFIFIPFVRNVENKNALFGGTGPLLVYNRYM